MNAVEALAEAAEDDPSTAAWIIGLEQHYDKIETCDGIGRDG